MSGDWGHGYPAGYREQLLAEVEQTSLPKERRAAIVAELERLSSRTADQNRADMETAGGARTAGRAPGDNNVGRHAADDEGDGR